VDSIANFPVGSRLQLKFKVGKSLIEVESEVRYCMPQIGMGVCFLNLKPEDRVEIALAVEDQS
jgi:hypothetical protein